MDVFVFRAINDAHRRRTHHNTYTPITIFHDKRSDKIPVAIVSGENRN